MKTGKSLPRLSPTTLRWPSCDLLGMWFVTSKAMPSSCGRDRSLVGAGAGQMSRVDSVQISIRKAAERARGSVLASDAFFPIPGFDS